MKICEVLEAIHEAAPYGGDLVIYMTNIFYAQCQIEIHEYYPNGHPAWLESEEDIPEVTIHGNRVHIVNDKTHAPFLIYKINSKG